MASGEVPITCPNCGQRTLLPVAAVRRDNYHCSKCFEKVPMSGLRTTSSDNDSRPQPARPKKSSRTGRRY